jgi:hypothetical protein
MNTADPIFHKPKSIIAAKNILYATIFLGLINSLIDRWTNRSSNISNTEGLIINLVTLLLMFFITVQIGLGKKWARTIFLILFILGIVLFPFAVIPVLKANILIGVLAIFSAILQIIALVFLFSKDSTHWFNAVKATTPQA